MKTLLVTLFLTFSSILIFSQTTVPEGEVSGIWTSSASPYLIEGNITVPTDSELIIESGVVVEFQGKYKLLVNGKLNAIGERTDSIIFTVNDTTGFGQLDQFIGGWAGIYFRDNPNTTDSNLLQYCIIEYVIPIDLDDISDYYDKGGSVSSTLSYEGAVLLENSWIRYNRKSIYSAGSRFSVTNCIVSDNLVRGIESCCGNPKIYGNIIFNNNGAYSSEAISNVIVNNTICFNHSTTNGGGVSISGDAETLYLYNCALFGNTCDGAGNLAFGHYSFVYFYNSVMDGSYMAGDSGPYFEEVYNTAYEDMFGNVENNSYTFSENSFLVDSGLYTVPWYQHREFDILGNPRIQNGRIDVGAIEKTPNTSINDVLSEDIEVKLFPNPATRFIKLNIGELMSSETEITILDMQGKNIQTEHYSNTPSVIDISSLRAGVYIVKIQSKYIDKKQLIVVQ